MLIYIFVDLEFATSEHARIKIQSDRYQIYERLVVYRSVSSELSKYYAETPEVENMTPEVDQCRQRMILSSTDNGMVQCFYCRISSWTEDFTTDPKSYWRHRRMAGYTWQWSCWRKK